MTHGRGLSFHGPGRAGHGPLRQHLKERDTSRLQLLVQGLSLEDLAGAGRDLLIDRLVDSHQVTPFEWGTPEVQEGKLSQRTYLCEDPMCPEGRWQLGSRRHEHSVSMSHLDIRVTAGDTSLLQYWPSGSHQALDQEFVSCTKSAITLRFHSDAKGAADVRRRVVDLNGLLEAANADIAEYNAALRARIGGLVDRRTAELHQRAQAIAATGFPVRTRRAAPVEYRIPDRSRDAQAPARPARPSEVGYQLSRDDFEAVLQCIASWADSAERHPGAAAGVGEEQFRNALLATLRGRFVDGAGEAFSVHGKTDLRILVRTAWGERGPQVFHAECKIWKGPASVDEALHQLVGLYSTHRDRLGALVFFVTDRRSPAKVTPAAVQRLVEHHGAVELAPVSGWPVVSIADPADADEAIELAVVVIDVQHHR